MGRSFFHTLTTFLQESQKRKLPMQSMCGTSSKKDVAEVMHYDRQSVRRYRDNYVCYCALLAAEKNLIKVQEDEDDASHIEDG